MLLHMKTEIHGTFPSGWSTTHSEMGPDYIFSLKRYFQRTYNRVLLFFLVHFVKFDAPMFMTAKVSVLRDDSKGCRVKN